MNIKNTDCKSTDAVRIFVRLVAHVIYKEIVPPKTPETGNIKTMLPVLFVREHVLKMGG